jgi:uncharacterized protein (DUF1684 family)
VEELDLLDWRRQVAALYDAVRAAAEPEPAWWRWRAGRDELFRSHPQSPLQPSARAGFEGTRFYAYDPAARASASVAPARPVRVEIAGSAGSRLAFTRFGRASFVLRGIELALDLYWLDAYGGGLFLPFGDATNGRTTYGGGRYLLDTVKGADLGPDGDRLLLDFNFAYNASCSYDDRWACPLAPPANRLALPIEAGEQHPAVGCG